MSRLASASLRSSQRASLSSRSQVAAGKIAQHGALEGGVDVLTGTAGMHGRHFNTAGFDKKRLGADVHVRAGASRDRSIGDDLGKTAGQSGRQIRIQKTFAAVDQHRAFIDLADPEKFVARRFVPRSVRDVVGCGLAAARRCCKC